MALGFTLWGTPIHTATDSSSYSYASTSQTLNRLYLAWAVSHHASAAPTQSLAVTGETVTEITNEGGSSGGNTFISGQRRIQAWWWVATSTGNKTPTISATSNIGQDLTIVEVTGANNASPIGASKDTGGSGGVANTHTMSFSALNKTDNRFAFCLAIGTNQTKTTDTDNWAAELEDTTHNNPATGVTTVVGTGTDTTCVSTWSTNVNFGWFGFEVVAATILPAQRDGWRRTQRSGLWAPPPRRIRRYSGMGV